MDARFVREGVRADDGLVRRHVGAGALLEQPRGAGELRRVDARVRSGEQLGARMERHHDFLERRVPRALADAVQRHLDLPRAGTDAGQRVRDREAEVVVAVRRDDDAGMLRGQLDDAPDRVLVLPRRREADGVGDVQRRRAALDHGGEDVEQILRIGARRVFRRELDLVDEPLGERHRHATARDHLVARAAQLVLQMDVRRREEDVDPASRRRRHRRGAGPDIVLGRPREPADRRALAAPHLLGHRPHGLRITGRGGGIAGLDHVHPSRVSWWAT